MLHFSSTLTVARTRVFGKCLLWLSDSYIALAPRTKGVKILKTPPLEIEQNLHE